MSVRPRLVQDAVYWAPLVQTRTGAMRWADAVPVKCHWEDVAKEFVDRQGRTQVSSSLIVVSVDVAIEGMLWLGNIDDVVDLAAPELNPGARKIRHATKTPGIGAREFIRVAYL